MAFRLPFHFCFIFNFKFLVFNSELVQSTFEHIPFASDLDQFGFSPPVTRSNGVILGRIRSVEGERSHGVKKA